MDLKLPHQPATLRPIRFSSLYDQQLQFCEDNTVETMTALLKFTLPTLDIHESSH